MAGVVSKPRSAADGVAPGRRRLVLDEERE